MNETLLPLMRNDGKAPVGLIYAGVRGRADKWFFLSDDAGRALRAESCLLEPEYGDTVLVCQGGGSAPSYILAVLARAHPNGASLTLPGGVAMRTEQGSLTMQAPASLALQAPRIGLSALHGDMKFRRLDAGAEQVNARFGEVALLARTLSSTVGRLLQKARDALRWIDNTDETRAGRMRLRVRERYDLTARHAGIVADDRVRVDGSKIDLG